MGTVILITFVNQYRTGKTLGSGTYAIVKEAVHIKTGKYYACKVINKKLMEGREFMVGRPQRYHSRGVTSDMDPGTQRDRGVETRVQRPQEYCHIARLF